MSPVKTLVIQADVSFRAFFLNGALEKNPQLCVVINDGASELGLQLRSIQECYSGSS